MWNLSVGKGSIDDTSRDDFKIELWKKSDFFIAFWWSLMCEKERRFRKETRCVVGFRLAKYFFTSSSEMKVKFSHQANNELLKGKLFLQQRDSFQVEWERLVDGFDVIYLLLVKKRWEDNNVHAPFKLLTWSNQIHSVRDEKLTFDQLFVTW